MRFIMARGRFVGYEGYTQKDKTFEPLDVNRRRSFTRCLRAAQYFARRDGAVGSEAERHDFMEGQSGSEV